MDSTTPVSPSDGSTCADVAQERRVGADDQHAAAREPVAVGVEQVGGAVQRDRGLAGARPALHHQHAATAARG